MITITVSKKILAIVVVVIILSVASYPAYHFYNEYQRAQNLLNNPEAASLAEIQTIINQIGQVLDLPQGEEPTLATVTDKSKLKDQPFFAKAEEGDKVLIYTQAKMAYLYRPSSGKVIEVGPISFSNDQKTAGASISAALQEVRVALLNGTDISGLSKRSESFVKQILPQAIISATSNASRNDYEKTVVAALSRNSEEAAQILAEALETEVLPLPDGETAPKDTDVVVILGRDRDR